MTNRSTKKEFVGKAQKIHGDKYDYESVEYVRNDVKVKIGCQQHGYFYQRPLNHLLGSGCPDCWEERRTTANRKTTKDFIKRATITHGDRYDYSLVNYTKAEDKVTIICKVHGKFQQVAMTHLCGFNCPKCRYETIAKKLALSKEEFVEKSADVHKGKYNYDLVDYVNSSTKVSIICPAHGVFDQIPGNHTKGEGCPSCARYGFDKSKPSLLYFVKIKKDYCTFWKIGVTRNSLKRRFARDVNYICEQYIWHFHDGEKAVQIEQQILKMFCQYKLDNFLFSLLDNGGKTECFDISLPHKNVIKQINSFKVNIEKSAL